MKILDVQKALRRHANKKKAKILARFFKTGPGEYGEGDCFLGIVVPHTRKIAKQFQNLDFSRIHKLLKSKYHEERLLALLILVFQFEKGDNATQTRIFESYLKNTRHINNWDLVDLTAPNIVGVYLFKRNRTILYRLAKSRSLWEKRIAILATFYFIQNHQFKDTFAIAESFLTNGEDLIHKAAGWMLREVGKHDLNAEEKFLKLTYKNMPRTMLRYAIERFPENKRKKYLNGDV